jgi:hypothetical protein
MKLGEPATVSGVLGSGIVAAGKYDRSVHCGYSTPDSGKMFLGVLVAYMGTEGSFSYGTFDWTVHDLAGTQVNATYADCNNLLEAGTLTSGRNAVGWIIFEIPKTWKHVWVDYAPGYAGDVFTWKLY